MKFLFITLMFVSLHYETFQNEFYPQSYGLYYNQNSVQNIVRQTPPRIYYRPISKINTFIPNNSYLMRNVMPESRNLTPENSKPKTENTSSMADKTSLPTENNNSTPEIITAEPKYNYISYLQKQVIILLICF